MSARSLLKKFTALAGLIAFIGISSAGCDRIKDLTEDKSYLTPLPQAALDAFQPGQLVQTRLQAVIAAQEGILTFHRNWISQPAAIFAEKMDYEAALQFLKQPETSDHYDPTPLNTPVWLVVFEGKWRIIAPLGTLTAPFSGCAYVVLNADDGMGMRVHDNSCEALNLDW
jgi:hypothetical protein